MASTVRAVQLVQSQKKRLLVLPRSREDIEADAEKRDS